MTMWFARARLVTAMSLALGAAGVVFSQSCSDTWQCVDYAGICICSYEGPSGDGEVISTCDASSEATPTCCADETLCMCSTLECLDSQRHVSSCTNPPAETGGEADASSSGSGGGTCPSSAGPSCESDSDCCSGTCAKITTSSSSKHCTLPCTEASDCDASAIWKPNPNPGFDCNDQTGYCY